MAPSQKDIDLHRILLKMNADDVDYKIVYRTKEQMKAEKKERGDKAKLIAEENKEDVGKAVYNAHKNTKPNL